jgi:protein-disulfide isomerase
MSAIALLAFGLFPVMAHAEDAPVNITPAPATTSSFTDAQKADIQNIIKDYLTKDHPEVLIAASQELQRRDEVSAKTKTETALKTLKDKIFGDVNSPIGGNPKGDVTVVEFFDYQCGYCKMAETAVEKLLKEDKNVKFIYKDFPILGPVSVTAAKASFAAARQGTPSYIKFHDALMAKKDHLNEDMIYQTAKDAGLDVDKLKKDMGDDAITKLIEANVELGKDVGVRGTPMFIVGEQVIPGALEYDQLKKTVDDERSGTAKKN